MEEYFFTQSGSMLFLFNPFRHETNWFDGSRNTILAQQNDCNVV